MKVVLPQLALVVIASLASILAAKIPTEHHQVAAAAPMAACKLCAGCDAWTYPLVTTMTEVQSTRTDARTFNIASSNGADSKMVADFTDSTNSVDMHTFGSKSVINNKTGAKVIVEVAFAAKGPSKKPMTQKYKVYANQKCSASLPDGYTSKDVTKITTYE